VLQCVAVCCSVLQCVAAPVKELLQSATAVTVKELLRLQSATQSATLQHTATSQRALTVVRIGSTIQLRSTAPLLSFATDNPQQLFYWSRDSKGAVFDWFFVC